MSFGLNLAAVRRVALALLACLHGIAAHAQSAPPPYAVNGPLLPLILQMPENGWLRVNANLYSDVWTPAELEPLDVGATHLPAAIIRAWSGFAWDTNRGDLLLYGGGHANYNGNDTYRWRSTTLRWERMSLPSEVWNDPVAGFQAIDGVDSAPSSAHTYKNNVFLPLADRFMTWGGAAYNNGGPYKRVSETNPNVARSVGPYLFDPNKADGSKVGGTTGSHVQRVAPHPEILGGRMWENRDLPKNIPSQQLSGQNANGCTQYAQENGHDVVYVAATNEQSTNLDLYRYQLTVLADPTQDTMTKVGIFYNGTAGTITCGFDPGRKLFVRTGNSIVPFLFWDLTSPGLSNQDQRVVVDPTIAAFQAWLTAQSFVIQNCAMEFDPVRKTYPIWCGGPWIWDLHAPVGGNTVTGWTMTQRPPPVTGAPSTAVHALSILGKWRYAKYFDAFVALEDVVAGNVWIYKPVGWQQPNVAGNALPTVSVISPAAGSTFVPGDPITLAASATDSNGSIARVEYYANGSKVGQSTTAPYTVVIDPILVGNYSIVAVAVDNLGGMAKSAPVAFTINAPLTTTVLQRGALGYAGATDTFLDSFARSFPRGAADPLYLDPTGFTPLLRFSVFQSEGGPVPNNAVLQSATLSLYKGYYDDSLSLNALLKPWTEAQATFNESSSGVPWTVPGAAGANTDFAAAADAVVTPSFNPGWVDIDVRSRLKQWAAGTANYGWRLSQLTGGGNYKTFTSSESTANPALRPKITVVYSAPSGTVTRQLSGTVVLGGSPMAGVALAATSGGACTTTNGAGQYACTVPQGWSGTVTPSASGYAFTPASRAYGNVAADQTGQDYVATATATSGAWVDDAVPAGAATAQSGGDAWTWIAGSLSPASGWLAHQSILAAGLHQHYFMNATATLPVAAGDSLFAYVYLDPASPPTEVMLQWFDGSWEHRAYWGANQIAWGADGTVARHYMGPLPPTGQWVNLVVPAAAVGLGGRNLTGMAFTLFGGRATWDHAGKVGGPVWVDDAVPLGATLGGDGGEGWRWVGAGATPFHGTLAHESAAATGVHQHYFVNATTPLAVAAGDTLFAYVYLDPANPPTEVMLQWNDGTWEHRAFWGADQIAWGASGTPGRRNMGALPALGQWVQLAVPAALVGLEGRNVNGIAFTLFGGHAYWDYAGKNP